MNIADLRRLYTYTEWANDRLLGVIAALPDEQFTRPIVSSFPSIRDTLAHIVSAEWVWLRRWLGESPLQMPDWLSEPSLATLQDELRRNEAERRAFLDRIDDETVAATIHYRSIKGDPFSLPLGETMLHCANHSTYHRGQLVTMLRQAGAHAVPSTDYSLFVRDLISS